MYVRFLLAGVAKTTVRTCICIQLRISALGALSGRKMATTIVLVVTCFLIAGLMQSAKTGVHEKTVSSEQCFV